MMKVWKIPEDQKQKLAELRAKSKSLAESWEKGWDLIKQLTGLKAQKRPPTDEMAFVPKNLNARLPTGLIWRKPRHKGESKAVVPDRRTTEGRAMIKAWKAAGITKRGLNPLEWYFGLFDGKSLGAGHLNYRTEVINGEEYVLDAGDIDLAAAGYELVDMELAPATEAAA